MLSRQNVEQANCAQAKFYQAKLFLGNLELQANMYYRKNVTKPLKNNSLSIKLSLAFKKTELKLGMDRFQKQVFLKSLSFI